MHRPYFNMNRPYRELLPRLLLLAGYLIGELLGWSS